MLFGVRLGVWGGAVWGALRVTVQAHFCEIDCRVQGDMQFGVLLQVLFWDAVWGAVGGASDGVWDALRGVLLEVLVCNHCYLGSMLVYLFFASSGAFEILVVATPVFCGLQRKPQGKRGVFLFGFS